MKFGKSFLRFRATRVVSAVTLLTTGLFIGPPAGTAQVKDVTAEQVVESAIAIAGNGFGQIGRASCRERV